MQNERAVDFSLNLAEEGKEQEQEWSVSEKYYLSSSPVLNCFSSSHAWPSWACRATVSKDILFVSG